MIKEKQEAAVSKAKETFNELADSYSEEFAERIGNIDAEPERERIFLLEEMIGDALSKSSAQQGWCKVGFTRRLTMFYS